MVVLSVISLERKHVLNGMVKAQLLMRYMKTELYMNVQDFIGDLSDHCAISVCLKLRRKVLNDKDLGKDPKLGKIKWNAEIERVVKLRLNNGLKRIKIE